MTVSSPVCVCVCVCVCACVCVYLQSGCVVGHGAAHPLVAAVLLDVCDPVLTLRHHLPPLQVEVLVDHLRRTHGGTTLWSHTEITHKGCRTQQRCALKHAYTFLKNDLMIYMNDNLFIFKSENTLNLALAGGTTGLC